MPEYVRAKDNQTGHHVSILREHLDAFPDGWTELKQDATYPDGTPLPPKYKTDVATEATKKSGNQAADSKE